MLKTKQIIFFFTIIFFLFFETSAQTTFGIKAGLNFSSAKYLNEFKNDLIAPYKKIKIGFNAGGFLNYELNKIISVQAEILYSQKGLKFEQIEFSENKIVMNYIEIPISGNYKISLSRHVFFNIYVGGYGAFWTDGKSIITDNITGETITIKTDFNNKNYKYNRIDAGILCGILFNLRKIYFDIRYVQGMINSSQNNSDAIINRLVSFSIGFKI